MAAPTRRSKRAAVPNPAYEEEFAGPPQSQPSVRTGDNRRKKAARRRAQLSWDAHRRTASQEPRSDGGILPMLFIIPCIQAFLFILVPLLFVILFSFADSLMLCICAFLLNLFLGTFYSLSFAISDPLLLFSLFAFSFFHLHVHSSCSAGPDEPVPMEVDANDEDNVEEEDADDFDDEEEEVRGVERPPAEAQTPGSLLVLICDRILLCL